MGTLRFNHNKYRNTAKVFIFNRKIIVILLFINVPLFGCSFAPEIVEQKISIEEQKSQCSIASDEYEYASEAYRDRLDSSVSRLGRTIDPGELNIAYEEAEALASYLDREEKKRNSKNFWCESVKPNSILYEVRGHIYLSREAAERSLDD